MALKSNTHTSGPGAVRPARDLAEHRERVCDVKQRTKSDPLERLLKRVTIDSNGCWVWQGWRDASGYGRISRGRQSEGNVSTHRFAYELVKGPIPQGLQIDHLCRNRPCCNPAHLEAVTCRVNVLRGETFQAANAAKTHCPLGHEYTPDNTYITGRGGRSCKACEVVRRRARGVAPARRLSAEEKTQRGLRVGAPFGPAPIPTEGIVDAYLSGAAPDDICARFGVSRKTLLRRVRAAGAPVRPQGGQR